MCSPQVGQKHGGFTGIIQRACSLSHEHIWFERKIAEDRQRVAKRWEGGGQGDRGRRSRGGGEVEGGGQGDRGRRSRGGGEVEGGGQGDRERKGNGERKEEEGKKRGKCYKLVKVQFVKHDEPEW